MLSAWQKRKSEPTSTLSRRKVPIGLIPYAQAMLLARVLPGRSGLLPTLCLEVTHACIGDL